MTRMPDIIIAAGLLILSIYFLVGCTTSAPSADCVLELYAPLSDAEIDKMSEPHAAWHDVVESYADRVCK